MVSFRVLFPVVRSRFLGANVMLSGSLLQWRLSLKLFISSWYASLSLLMAFTQCCRQWMISFYILYGQYLNFYCPVKVGFRYMDDLNACCVQIINTSRKNNLLSCSFFKVNFINGLVQSSVPAPEFDKKHLKKAEGYLWPSSVITAETLWI